MKTIEELTHRVELRGGPFDGERLRVLPDQHEFVLPIGSAARHAERFSRYVADGDGRMVFQRYLERKEVVALR